jgi:Myb-like DNA-binding domain
MLHATVVFFQVAPAKTSASKRSLPSVKWIQASSVPGPPKLRRVSGRSTPFNSLPDPSQPGTRSLVTTSNCTNATGDAGHESRRSPSQHHSYATSLLAQDPTNCGEQTANLLPNREQPYLPQDYATPSGLLEVFSEAWLPKEEKQVLSCNYPTSQAFIFEEDSASLQEQLCESWDSLSLIAQRDQALLDWSHEKVPATNPGDQVSLLSQSLDGLGNLTFTTSDELIPQPGFRTQFGDEISALPTAVSFSTQAGRLSHAPVAEISELAAPRRCRGQYWSLSEDDLLKDAIQLEGGPPYPWKYISQQYFGSARTATMCKSRWNKVSENHRRNFNRLPLSRANGASFIQLPDFRTNQPSTFYTCRG